MHATLKVVGNHVKMTFDHSPQPGGPAGRALRGFSEDVGLGVDASDQRS